MNYTVSLGDGADVTMTAEQIRAACRAGTLTPKTLVWREGLDRWLSIAALADEMDIDFKEATALAVVDSRPEVGTPSLMSKKSRPQRPRTVEEVRREIGRPRSEPHLATNMIDQHGRPVMVVVNTKSRGTFVLFAVIFGSLGLHNFYAGYVWAGVFQALLSICFLPMAVLVWVVALAEAIFTVHDANGNRMT